MIACCWCSGFWGCAGGWGGGGGGGGGGPGGEVGGSMAGKGAVQISNQVLIMLPGK